MKNDYFKKASELVADHDSDIAWAGNVMRKAKQLKHADLKKINTEILNNSGIKYKVASEEAYLFREDGKPKVDFYPSTGRWRVAGGKINHRGGAKAFLKWYEKTY